MEERTRRKVILPTTSEAPEISVVIPAYNEELRCKSTLPQLWGALNRRFATFEVIVVDDGSNDNTARVVSQFSDSHHNVRLISYPENRGKGYAVRRGYWRQRADTFSSVMRIFPRRCGRCASSSLP
jgi:cellulose synthase/poly-beta-1,6-N-acetylglucosamine synthase-like glycosyltransferase